MKGMLKIQRGCIKGVLSCPVWPYLDQWNLEMALAGDQNRTFTYSFDTNSSF